MILRATLPFLSTLLLLPMLSGCGEPRTSLEKVLDAGELRVITRNSATTYYEGAHGPTGMEYDLVQGFADKLGVKLQLKVAANVPDVLRRVAKGQADLAAAGLTVTEQRQALYRFGPSYQSVTPQLVYRLKAPRPQSLGDLNGHLEIMSGSSHGERLRLHQADYPNLSWTENQDAETEELLALVSEGLLDYTVADSNEVAIQRRFYPQLRVAFDLAEPEPLAWAFAGDGDDSLVKAAEAYFDEIKASDHLAHLMHRHYGHVENFDYAGTLTFQSHIQGRLPTYQALFQNAAREADLDWRLVAAVGYQESHWNPNAVSPTGVRGLMMLTKATAQDLGVKQRTDADQSIQGGTRYLGSLIKRIPERIQGPDRIWFALAAYNVGLGHLEDARVLTEARGGNADRWSDVKETLPLLRKRKWHSKTRYGYARGDEAVRYVENIRSYYEILVRALPPGQPAPPSLPKALTIATGRAL